MTLKINKLYYCFMGGIVRKDNRKITTRVYCYNVSFNFFEKFMIKNAYFVPKCLSICYKQKKNNNEIK